MNGTPRDIIACDATGDLFIEGTWAETDQQASYFSMSKQDNDTTWAITFNIGDPVRTDEGSLPISQVDPGDGSLHGDFTASGPGVTPYPAVVDIPSTAIIPPC